MICQQHQHGSRNIQKQQGKRLRFADIVHKKCSHICPTNAEDFFRWMSGAFYLRFLSAMAYPYIPVEPAASSCRFYQFAFESTKSER